MKNNSNSSLKQILLFSSTIVIFTIISLVSYFLIVVENKNFNEEIKRNEKELLQSKKIYLENRLKLILTDIKNDMSLIEKSELQKVEDFVNMLEKVVIKNSYKSQDEVKNLLDYYDNDDSIFAFAFDSKGTLLWNPKNRSFEGDNFIYIEDINSFSYVKTIIEKAKNQDKTPTEFTWYTANDSKISNNIVYARYIPKLDLIVAAYVSKDLIKEKIKNLILESIKKSKFSDDIFLSIDYLKSYRMIKDYIKPLINIGKNEYLKALNSEKNRELIANNYRQNGFSGIKYITFKQNLQNYIAYSTILPQYRWMITLGENLDYLTAKQLVQKKEAQSKLNNKIIELVMLSIGAAIFFFVLSIFLSRKIEKILIDYQNRADNESNKYQALFEHSNDSFLLANIDFSIIDGNKKAFILSKLTKDELLKSKLNTFFPHIDFEEIKEKKSGYERTEFIDSLNNEKIVEFTYAWIVMEYEKVIFASIRDITERMKLISERKEHEQILIQQSKMAAMGEMIGNIAHQWRQPLSQISGLFMDISSAYDYDELNEKYMKKTVDEADDIIEYMSHTIDDFRNFFSPHKTKENFFTSEALNRAVNIIKSSFEFYEIDLKINIDSERPIFGYPNEYSQVLLNILSNSKDIFILREIKNPKITIDINYKNGRTNMIIKDNAGGIKKEILTRIFEPYFTTKFNYGTGIGLYMSKIIIEKNMNGFISAENIKNGAKFTISV